MRSTASVRWLLSECTDEVQTPVESVYQFRLQATHYSTMYKNFGLSAGLTFSMLLSDGKLKQSVCARPMPRCGPSISIKQSENTKESVSANARRRCRDYDTRLQMLNAQMTEYKHLLICARKKSEQDRCPVFDYITTLKTCFRSTTENDHRGKQDAGSKRIQLL